MYINNNKPVSYNITLSQSTGFRVTIRIRKAMGPARF